LFVKYRKKCGKDNLDKHPLCAMHICFRGKRQVCENIEYEKRD
jgi:hypothetical protein